MTTIATVATVATRLPSVLVGAARAAARIPAALRPVVVDAAPAGWERGVHDPSRDGDVLTWLGFEPGRAEEPLIPWARSADWPAGLRQLRPLRQLRTPLRSRTA